LWLCSSSTSIIEDRDLSAHLNILTIRDRSRTQVRRSPQRRAVHSEHTPFQGCEPGVQGTTDRKSNSVR
jgi:hypothetical protein